MDENESTRSLDDPGRVVESRRIYDGRVINLRLDTVELQGRRRDREVVEHAGAAVILAVLEPRSIVLVRQWRHAVGAALWEVPAGGVEAGESAEESAIRELREETGYRAASVERIFSCYSAPGFSNELLHFFVARDLRVGPSSPDEDEEIVVETFTFEEASAMLRRGEIVDAKTVIALLWIRYASDAS